MSWYVGFPQSRDPGLKKALRGRRWTRRRVVATIPESYVTWQIKNPIATRIGTGVAMVQSTDDAEKVYAIAPTTGRTLTVYYKVDWPSLGPSW